MDSLRRLHVVAFALGAFAHATGGTYKESFDDTPRVRSRTHTRDDQRAFNKRVSKRRAKKGYK